MKKSLFYFFMLMAVAVMPLTSCEKESQDEEQVEELRIPVTTYDALSWLQGSLVVVDENGDIFRRVYGNAFDESQPDVISVPVADYAAAEELFLSWVAPTKEATKVDGGYDYNLTDMMNQAQGSVSFRSVAGEAGVLARMSVAEGTDLKHISEVNFIDSKLWPENAAFEQVEAGKIYYIEDNVLTWTEGKLWDDFNGAKKESLPFYCIQSNTDGKKGVLVWLSPDRANDGKIRYHHKTSYYADEEVFKYLATQEEIDEVRKFYDNNQTFWNNMLKEMDAKGLKWSPQPEGTNLSTFIYQYRYYYDLGVELIRALDLADSKSNIVGLTIGRWPWFDYHRYMHVELIPPVVE